jgi:hypothetical protein
LEYLPKITNKLLKNPKPLKKGAITIPNELKYPNY